MRCRAVGAIPGTESLSDLEGGENVAFQKKKYFEIGGHGLKINEQYANLELLINHFIRKKDTTILFQSETAIKKTEDLVWNDYLEILK